MHRLLTVPVLIGALGLVGCGRDDGALADGDPYVAGAGAERTAYGDEADWDTDIGTFLNERYDDNPMFADDELTFDVRQGAVTVNGTVDSLQERDELVGWANEVPGVRTVDATNLRPTQ